jgi:hypothetical protein
MARTSTVRPSRARVPGRRPRTSVERAQKTRDEIRAEAEVLSALLTATPNLRARFFANPTRQAGKSLPPAKSWDYRPSGSAWLPWNWYGSPFRYRRERAQLAKSILGKITSRVQSGDQSQAISVSVNTDSVYEEYFAPIVKISQRSFTSVFYLSIAAFVVGISLIGAGIYLAIAPRTGTNSTVVSSIFGGGGAISALGAVLAMATRGIREATLDHARVRLVLTAFATQLGQLRAIIEKPPLQNIPEAEKLNDAIGKSIKAALDGIPSPVEIKAAALAGNSAAAGRKWPIMPTGKSSKKSNGSTNSAAPASNSGVPTS